MGEALDRVTEFRRQVVRDLWAELPEDQQTFFMRIFAGKTTDYDPGSIPLKDLNSATELLERSVAKLKDS